MYFLWMKGWERTLVLGGDVVDIKSDERKARRQTQPRVTKIIT